MTSYITNLYEILLRNINLKCYNLKENENCLFKTDVSISEYLNLFENDKHRHEIAKLRLSSN